MLFLKSNTVQVQAGKLVASETEMIVLEEYLGSYLEVRLSNSFLVEVCKPVIQMIDFFKSNSMRVQYRYEKRARRVLRFSQ